MPVSHPPAGFWNTGQSEDFDVLTMIIIGSIVREFRLFTD